MRLLLHLVTILLMLLLVTDPGNPDPVSATRVWQSKVDSAVLNALAGGDTEFILFLSEQADLSGASQMKTKQEKGEYVYQSLIDVASRTQGEITITLSEMGILKSTKLPKMLTEKKTKFKKVGGTKVKPKRPRPKRKS